MKNKHAKGPDGNPVAALNGGRGRGRPKKTLIDAPSMGLTAYGAGGLYSHHLDPTSLNYFKTQERCGGPIFPDSGFRDIYNEIYIRKSDDDQFYSTEKREGENEMDESGRKNS